MDSKIKDEPASPASPKRKQKGGESPKSPPPSKGRISPMQPHSTKSVSGCSETAQALSKVKRLLQTLVQHADEMGCSTGEKVKSVVIAMVAGTISLEDFQTALIESTGCPLRPFVLPYLQAYLPILQHDVSVQARHKKQGILEYITNCESAILERGSSPSLFASEVFGKRRIQERSYEEDIPPLKRPLLVPVHPMGMSSETALGTDEQWRNIHVMLNCILSMVEKTKQALALLQHGPREQVQEEERLTAHTVHVAEERIAQIKKKAEDAITEIKVKAQQELEKATASLKIPRSRPYQDFF